VPPAGTRDAFHQGVPLARLACVLVLLATAACGAAWRANHPSGAKGVPSDWAIVDAVAAEVLGPATGEGAPACVPECPEGLICDEASGHCVPEPPRAPPDGGPRYR